MLETPPSTIYMYARVEFEGKAYTVDREMLGPVLGSAEMGVRPGYIYHAWAGGLAEPRAVTKHSHKTAACRSLSCGCLASLTVPWRFPVAGCGVVA